MLLLRLTSRSGQEYCVKLPLARETGVKNHAPDRLSSLRRAIAQQSAGPSRYPVPDMPSIQGIQVSLPIQRAHLDGLVVFVAVAELRGFRAAARGYAMKAVRISGTENYAEEAPELLKRYESISFADHHRLVMHLIPTVPGRVLDIGAGTGRDAAGFVGLGHSVVAVEPTEELHRGAMLLHPSPMIEWIDDKPAGSSPRGRRTHSFGSTWRRSRGKLLLWMFLQTDNSVRRCRDWKMPVE